MSKHDPFNQVGLDPRNPEDMKTTIEEISDFIDSERAAAGQPPCKTLIIIGSDIPYELLGEYTDVEF